MTDEEKQLFTPAEAAEYLSKRAGRKITVGRLAQLRREKRVTATIMGYNTTVYTRKDLDSADVSLNFGRTSRDNGTDENPEFLALAS